MNEMTNLYDIVKLQASKYSNKEAVYYGDSIISYKELKKHIDNFSIFLNENDILTGDIIGSECKDEYTELVVMFALSKIGATLISLKGLTQTQCNELIDTLNIKSILTDNNKKENIYTVVSQENFILECSEEYDNYCKNPKSPWIYIVGSGTTGKSKIIPVSHFQQLQRAKASLDWLNNSKDDVVHSLVNISYYSSKVLYIQALLSASSCVLTKYPLDVFLLYKEFKISVMYMTVFHIEQLLNIINQEKFEGLVFPYIRALVIDGSKVSMSLRERIYKSITKNIYVRYGINEVGTVSLCKAEEVFEHEDTVGFSIKEVDLKIVDKEGNDLDPNKIGEIKIRSNMLVDGYINDSESTNKAFKDEWFFPGDLGMLTEGSHLIILGRSDNMMILNGINIYPSQIEKVMLKHDEVVDAFAFSLNHQIHQDVPVCAIVNKVDSNITDKDLMNYAIENLGSYRPQAIVIFNKFPINEHGKIVKSIVKEKVIETIF